MNGVYTGVLSNDSTTVRKDQSFEMALTEYNGKVYGYAYSTFIVNDTLYYIVKRVKGKVEGDICEVEDDEVITHNFPQKPEKKVFVTYTLRRNASDSLWRLDGNWKTNATKKYYAISGNVETKEERDLSKSKLYEHLGDLDLQKDLVLTRPKEKVPEQKTTKTKTTRDAVAKNNEKKGDKRNTKSDEKKPDASVAKAETKAAENKTADKVNDQPVPNDKKDVVKANTNMQDKATDPLVAKTESKSADNKPASNDKKPEATVAKSESKVPGNTSNPVSLNPPVQNEKKEIASSNSTTVDKKPENNIAKADTRIPDNKTIPAATNNTQVQNATRDIASNNEKKPDIAKQEQQLPSNKPAPVIQQPVQSTKKDAITSTPVSNNPQSNNVKQEVKPQDNKQNNAVVSVPVKPDEKKNTVPVTSNPTAKVETKAQDNKPTNSPIVTSPPVQNNPSSVAANDKKAEPGYEFQEIRRNRALKPAAKLVDGRVTDPSETIYFKSDSISIALYDNGEVDGDTVSVIINDEMFIEKQGLRSSAFRKTFYIPQDQGDSLLVVLFANNLGKYPPNTGLLQIKDGDDIFYVRFKADLDKNAAIVLRRKYK